MPTFQDLGKEYATYIRQHIDSPTLVSDLIANIKTLRYTKSGESLTEVDTNTLVLEIEKQFSPEAQAKGFKNFAEDSRKFIQMIQMIKKELGKKE
ncbi:MAG: hypothetical protein NTX59_00985 [Elusimicrobia bacterium]|nr:hypothetical protein [Elusimicrobiota bacterium]